MWNDCGSVVEDLLSMQAVQQQSPAFPVKGCQVEGGVKDPIP